MFIEIKGVGFVNKGAELMLRAILQRLEPDFPEARFVLKPTPYDYENRAKLGLYQKIWFQKFGIQFGYLGKFIPAKLRQMYGTVTPEEISLVLDASGFTYSDQWGPKQTKTMAKAAAKYYKQGTPIILMPQAFGPFSSSEIRSNFKNLAKFATYIFPRDSVSYKHVTEIVGESPKIIQTPDFTIGVKGTPPESFEGNRIAIVPNYRMIDKTSKGDAGKYLPFLASCIRTLISLGENPFFLIHEGEPDKNLAERINQEYDFNLEIHREDNSLKLKGIIGTCKGMIGSRFHGLVSALSQGVPALAIGWSHKYEMLFEDFDFAEGLLSFDMNEIELAEKISLLSDPEKREIVLEKIEPAKQRNLTKVEDMWSMVIETIRKKKK